mmetsp:Transcript_3888/g.7967  ORF Transcript_3888/g.7967 Transcript_3888/m.7967 type:complete len:86 (-) Transcript_3888:37-294(-)
MWEGDKSRPHWPTKRARVCKSLPEGTPFISPLRTNSCRPCVKNWESQNEFWFVGQQQQQEPKANVSVFLYSVQAVIAIDMETVPC